MNCYVLNWSEILNCLHSLLYFHGCVMRWLSLLVYFSSCLLTLSFCLCCRQRKDELEQRMSSLQESRRELMVQLEGLMKLLKVTHAEYSLTLEGNVSPFSPLFSSFSNLLFPPFCSFLAPTVSDLFFSTLFLPVFFQLSMLWPCRMRNSGRQ